MIISNNIILFTFLRFKIFYYLVIFLLPAEATADLAVPIPEPGVCATGKHPRCAAMTAGAAISSCLHPQKQPQLLATKLSTSLRHGMAVCTEVFSYRLNKHNMHNSGQTAVMQALGSVEMLLNRTQSCSRACSTCCGQVASVSGAMSVQVQL